MANELNKKVYVAMSGGVDSSVAATLLKKRGFDVVGVFMKPWQPEASSFCMWKEDREDAMRAASALSIPFKTWDFSKEYKKLVTDYMVREYKAGRTPNPDVMCNKEIKFGLFFDKAMKEGADFIATGHYARIISRKNSKRGDPRAGTPVAWRSSKDRTRPGCGGDRTPGLYIAKDLNKDQSYFLWIFKQKQLAKCLFPIGDHVKPEVRKLAKKFGLPNHDKKDSQGVCFIGPLDMKSFLQTKIKPKQGEIRLLRFDLKGLSKSDLENSVIIGNHDGVYYYTIGQRHGLNISIGGGPYYVVFKDIKKNIIYVGTEKDLYSKNLKISNISWVSLTWKLGFQVRGIIEIDVKIRYRSKSEKAILSKNGTLKFFKPVRAITPGQSAVFYRKNELLGGGIII